MFSAVSRGARVTTGLVGMGGDRHHVAHWRVIFRSRPTIVLEQAHASLLGNAPTLGGKVIPYWLALAAANEFGCIDVDAIDSPTSIRGRSSTHLGELIRVILGGLSAVTVSNSRSWAAGGRCVNSPSALHAVSCDLSNSFSRSVVAQSLRRSHWTGR
jgi:hypothetical protein